MSLSVAELKYLRGLRQNKFRKQHQVFVAEGVKLAAEILRASTIKINNIYATEDWLLNQEALIASKKVPIRQISPKNLSQISNLKTPNQVFMVCRIPDIEIDTNHLVANWSLYLEDLQDPGNLGTILRIADWFGIPYVFCSEKTVDWTNPKVIQSTMGAFLRVQIMKIPFTQLVSKHPTMPILGAVLAGENIFSLATPDHGVLVIGNESKGISSDIIQQLDQKIKIPKGQNGGAESLNAAVATGIICSQIISNR